jgi:hypothetical protein
MDYKQICTVVGHLFLEAQANKETLTSEILKLQQEKSELLKLLSENDERSESYGPSEKRTPS